MNVLGVKDVCSLGPGFARALYVNASRFVRVTKEDKTTCEEKCGGQRSMPMAVPPRDATAGAGGCSPQKACDFVKKLNVAKAGSHGP